MKIQDVARKANVGVGTVSRVLNKSGYVSDETRERVEKAIQELQYTPNELARNLYHNKTNTIAVILPDASNPYYAFLLNEIEKSLRVQGYKTLLCNTVGEKTNEELYLNMLQRNMVDGVLTGTHTLDNWKYAEITGPVVSFDTPPLSDMTPVITVDHRTGGRKAAQLLLDSGCRHVVQFRDDIFGSFPFSERHIEFEKTIREAGAVCENYISHRDCFAEEFYEDAAKDCFRRYPDIDGIFGTDMIAAFSLRRALMLGKKVPEELKIVAFDGTYLVDSIYPTLTCICQPIADIAKAGVDQLIRLIKGDEKPVKKQIKLPVTVKVGMTTIATVR